MQRSDETKQDLPVRNTSDITWGIFFFDETKLQRQNIVCVYLARAPAGVWKKYEHPFGKSVSARIVEPEVRAITKLAFTLHWGDMHMT